jgi:hypothetical protein
MLSTPCAADTACIAGQSEPEFVQHSLSWAIRLVPGAPHG